MADDTVESWRRRSLWLFILFKAFLYLPFEFMFNASLVGVIAAGASVERLHGLELLGRSLSSMAGTFIAWRFVIRRVSHQWVSAALFASFMVVFPIVFFGQKAVVNSIADRATDEQRYVATLMRFLPVAIRAGKVRTFEFAADERDPAATTFRALGSSALFFSPTAYRDIESQIGTFAYNEAIHRTFSGGTDRSWKAYTGYRDQLIALYGANGPGKPEGTYLQASTALEEAKQTPEVVAERLWHEVNREVAQAWQTARDTPRGREADARLPELYNGLLQYFHLKSSAFRRSAVSRYDRQMIGTFHRSVPDTTWCEDDTHCPGSYEFVESKAKELAGVDSQTATGQFDLDSPQMARIARERLRSRGIVLADSWRLSDKDAFMAVAIPAVRSESQAQYEKLMRRAFGNASIAPGLSFDAFERQAAVQSSLRNRLERSLSIPLPPGPVSVMWTRAEFERRIVRSASDSLQRAMVGPVASYADGGEREGVGRQSVRLILIPVISIALSLYFSLTNVVSVLTMLPAQIAASLNRAMGMIFVVASLVVIPLLPFLAPMGLANTDGYRMWSEHTRAATLEERLPILPVKWVFRLEPVVLPRGQQLIARLGEPGFALHTQGYCNLTRIDRLFIGWIRGSDRVECEASADD